MGNFRYASLRYCSVLKRNVVFENYYDSEGKGVSDCIYKSLCNYDKCGCRNSLFAGFMPAVATVGDTGAELRGDS